MTEIESCSVMLCMPSFLSGRAVRSGRADRTVTRHLSQAGSYQVTAARPDHPNGRSDAASPKPTGPSKTPDRVSLTAGQTPGRPRHLNLHCSTETVLIG